MGGIGSTRWGRQKKRRPHTDRVTAFSVRALLEAARFRFPAGCVRKHTGRLWLGAELGLLAVSIDTASWPNIAVTLADAWHLVLVPVRTANEGTRFWFSCPECERRVGTLYYWPSDGWVYAGDWYGGRPFEWACRRCHQLLYPSQVEGKRARADRRWVRVLRQLKAEPGKSTARPPRPRGMHQRTYARLLVKLEFTALRRATVAGKGLSGIDERYPWPDTFPQPKAKPRGRSVRFRSLDWRSRMGWR